MSDVRVRVGVAVEAGIKVRRARAIHDVLAFALDVLRLQRLRHIVDKGVDENPWITRMRVVGLDGDGAIREELVFDIDWERHRIHMSQGRSEIEVPEARSLVAAVSPDLFTALRLFKESCVRSEYEVTCYFKHIDVDGLDVGGELGLGRPVTLRFAGERLCAQVPTGELDEVSTAYSRYGRL